MNPRTPLTSSLALLAFGCGGGAEVRTSAISVVDSAGVQIVTHPAGYEKSLPVWTVTKMIVEIGASNDRGHDLDLVRGATRLSDGRIVVANGGSRELRFFDRDGAYLSASGRQGQGPGEFVSLVILQRLAGDTLAAIDGDLRRMSIFSPAGAFLRSLPAAYRGEREHGSANGLLANGRMVGGSFSDDVETGVAGPVQRRPFAVVLFGVHEKRVDTVAVVPGLERYEGLGHAFGKQFPTSFGLQFGRQSVYTTDGVRIYIGTNEPEGIRVYNVEGQLLRLIRSESPPEPVTTQDRERREREELEAFERRRSPEQSKAEWLKDRESVRYAKVFPDYERLLIGIDGTLWQERVRRANEEAGWFIVNDSTGKVVARVRYPDNFRPYEVGPNEIIGRWLDADGVSHVRAYRVRR